ncbi:glycerate kinase family protein [Pseudalkalibacillus salsuginis]|uniref:glycerate kinase family protein n=1 Tax=Pseudalkalibacillus salsuginis TaxID=2910972 RepID=UPI001F2D6707|nr:glycerate kinase [Pseudalkalibacillus salsuginis]MCF6409772.1 glycerate kinase [Pseudalkalibacillus salsuginis]
MNILVAPSGFKESLGADQIATCMKKGILNVIPGAKVTTLPLVDGGEGFTETMVNWTNGELHTVVVTGPLRKKVEALIGFLGDTQNRTAVIEMASAAGLKLVPRYRRNPLLTTSYGVGELIQAALDLGAERILIGCGDSGINDGGIGMAEALGIRFFDQNMNQIDVKKGAVSLQEIDSIDLSLRDPRLNRTELDVACNWHNILCGVNGVARVFGPQKGAKDQQIALLEEGLEHYAAKIKETAGYCVREIPGGGASGGLGTGLQALLGAVLHPRFDLIMDYMDINDHLQKADLVLTAEGSIDFQTPRGKIPALVADKAKAFGKPVIAIAGTIGKDAQVNYHHGIDVFTSILQSPSSLEQAMEKTEEWVIDCTETTMRMLSVGFELAASVPSFVLNRKGIS